MNHDLNGHFTLLAKHNDYRYITVCEHGTVHVNWGNATLRMPPAAFARISRVLEQAAADPNNIEERCEGRLCLLQGRNGAYQLLVGDTGLYLNATELLVLIDLVQAAIDTLTGGEAPYTLEAPQDERALNAVPGQRALHMAGSLFSAN